MEIELCKYCPWTKESHHPEITCEGDCCDKAKENYLDEMHLKNEESHGK